MAVILIWSPVIAAQTFTLSSLEEIASTYQKTLIDSHADTAASPGLLLRQSGQAAKLGKWQAARLNLEKLTAISPQSGSTWLRLAQAWQASDSTDERAAAAAYQAYRYSLSDEVRLDALFTLGDLAFEIWSQQSRTDVASAIRWRDISKRVFTEIGQSVSDDQLISKRISALNQSALTVSENSRLRNDRRESGDSAPLCTRFSEKLITDLDQLANYVEVRTTNTNLVVPNVIIRVYGNDFCAMNLPWGHEYVITFKPGLPAVNGLTLEAEQTISGKIPPAPASIGFNRRGNYVLASEDSGNVAIKSVNVATAKISLYRISDRSLLRTTVLAKGKQTLSSTEHKSLRNETGELIWTLEADLAGEANTEFSANVPVGDIIRIWEDAARRGDINNVSGPIGEFIKIDRSRPDQLERLGPAAYALVVDSASVVDISEQSSTDEPFKFKNPVVSKKPVKWVVHSNLGITLFRSSTSVHGLVRRLSDGGAVEAAEVELLARNGRVLASGTTDAFGAIEFESRLVSGLNSNQFKAMTVYSGEDFGYISADNARLNLTDLPITGRSEPSIVDVFVALEREINRPGDELSALLLARSPDGSALENLPPVDVILESENGIKIHQVRISGSDQDWAANGRLARVPIPVIAPIGPAKLVVKLAGLDTVLGSAPVQITQFKPERAKLRLDGDWTAVKEGNTVLVQGAARAEHLYGVSNSENSAFTAPVKHASLDAWMEINEAPSPHQSCYQDFAFGLADESSVSMRRRISDILQTDQFGRVEITSSNTGIPLSSKPRAIQPILHLLDETGVMTRLEAKTPIPLRENKNWLGARMKALHSPLITGQVALELISLNGDLNQQSAQLRVRIVRERTNFVWSGSNAGWDYSPSVETTTVAEDLVSFARTGNVVDSCLEPKSIVIDPKDGETFSLGTYRVELLNDKGDPVTTIRFQVGSANDQLAPSKPQYFQLNVSNERVATGEALDIAASGISFSAGHMMFGFVSAGEIIQWQSAPILDGRSNLTFEIPSAWQSGSVHVLGMAYRNATGVALGPERAVGLTNFNVSSKSKQFAVTIESPRDNLPNKPTKVSLRTDDIASDEKAFAVVFAVDEGIQQILDYELQNPFSYFHGTRQFPFEIQDVYSKLVRNEPGQLLGENGSDVFSEYRIQGYDSTKLIAHVSGPLQFVDGKADFELPPFEFTGLVRLSAIAWTADRTGFVNKTSLRIFDSTELILSVPENVAPGDKVTVSATFRNLVQELAREYRITMQVNGASANGDSHVVTETFVANPSEFHSIKVPIEIPAAGVEAVDIVASVSSIDREAVDISETARMSVGTPVLPRTELVYFGRLTPGQTTSFDRDELVSLLGLNGRYAQAQFNMSAEPLNKLPTSVATLAEVLAVTANRDLHGIASEATLSIALNLLDADDASFANKVLALQAPDGGFLATAADSTGFFDYGARPQSMWQSAIGLDYLQYAANKGAASNLASIDAANGFLSSALRSYLTRRESLEEICVSEVMFSALVLSRSDSVDRKSYESIQQCTLINLSVFESSILISFLLAYGDTNGANLVLQQIVDDTQIASDNIDELAMSIALLAENNAPKDVLSNVVNKFYVHTLSRPKQVSVRASAWLARAEQSIDKVFGQSRAVSVSSSSDITAAQSGNNSSWSSKLFDLTDPKINIDLKNDGPEDIELFAHVRTRKSSGVGAASGPIELRRRIFTAAGDEITESTSHSIQKNDIAIFYMEGVFTSLATDLTTRLVVPLPAGFETVETRLDIGSIKEILGPSISLSGSASYVESQNDRMLVLISPDRDDDSAHFKFAFAARATIEGEFIVPTSAAENLANQSIYGNSSTMTVKVVSSSN